MRRTLTFSGTSMIDDGSVRPLYNIDAGVPYSSLRSIESRESWWSRIFAPRLLVEYCHGLVSRYSTTPCQSPQLWSQKSDTS